MKKRTVLLTGASRGIGKAIRALLSPGYRVIAPTRRELDLSDTASVRKYCEKLDGIPVDILVNNAGINAPQWIDEVSDENMETTFTVNLISPLSLIRAVVPGMKKRRWGRIVNVSSMFGIIARGKQSLYSASKHGINGATKALALELAPYNILVNSVCPGFTDTGLVSRNPKGKINALVADIPLGRLARPDEIAKLVRFLVSEDNTYMTGGTILIDGGYSSH